MAALSYQEWLKANGFIGRNPNDPYLEGAYKQYLTNYNSSQYNHYLNEYHNGNMSAVDFQGALANNGIYSSPEQTQWLNNQAAIEQTEAERAYNTQMRDSSITSAANQYASLGLNPASVMSTGGAGIGNTGAVADTSKANPALDKALQDFNNKASMTRTIVGLIGGLGSAGIIGGSRLLARSAASAAAAATANSGLNVLKQSNPRANYSWDRLIKELD